MSIRGYFHGVQAFHDDRAAVADAGSVEEIAGIVNVAAARNEEQGNIHQPSLDKLREDAQSRLAALGVEAIGLAGIGAQVNALSAKVERTLLDLACGNRGSRTMAAMSILDTQETAKSLVEELKQLPEEQLAAAPKLAELAEAATVGTLLDVEPQAAAVEPADLSTALSAVATGLDAAQKDLSQAGLDHLRQQDAAGVEAILGPEDATPPAAQPKGPAKK